MEDIKVHGIPPNWLGMVDLRRLQAFVLAARTGSFAMAAQALCVVPSAISHAIKGLEEEFNCNLFKRSGPRILLTHEGHRLMPFAQDVFDRIGSLKSEVTRLRDQKDYVRLVAPEIITGRLLPEVLPKFHECVPSATFELVHAANVRDVAQLLDGQQVDIAVAIAGTLAREYVRRDLFEETIGFFAAATHPLASKAHVSIADMERRALMTCDVGLRDLFFNRMSPTTSNRSHFWVLASTESVQQMAKINDGIAMLPLWAMKAQLESNEFTMLAVAGPRLARTWAGHWLGTLPQSWAGELLLSLIETSGKGAHVQAPLMASNGRV